MRRKTNETKEVRELVLTAECDLNPLIDFTDGGDFAVSNHIADIVGADIVRSQMNVVVLCAKGILHAGVNGQEVVLKANEILVCPSRTLLSMNYASDDAEVKVAALSDRLVYNMLGDKLDVWIKGVYVNNITRIALTDAECHRLALYIQLSRSIIDGADIPFRSELVRTQLEAMMFELIGHLSLQPGVQAVKASYSKVLFYKFLKSLSSATVKRKSVKAYADELAITPKYLSFICDKYSGCTALEWIDKFVMEDARYYLKTSDMSIKEIATLLGFPNNSFFGRYVVRHVGMSPIAYRRSLNG
ncbi:MAG: AraC family transcriptional regulator [Bacteroidaceae bacterium]|nr:AraC family transcriptional regulator [Bacteroidaceae bacterium]